MTEPRNVPDATPNDRKFETRLAMLVGSGTNGCPCDSVYFVHNIQTLTILSQHAGQRMRWILNGQ